MPSIITQDLDDFLERCLVEIDNPEEQIIHTTDIGDHYAVLYESNGELFEPVETEPV